MDVYILNKNFETVDIVDNYISLVWVDRYADVGEFEIRIPAEVKKVPKFRPYFYVFIKRSEHLMVIEHIHLDTSTGDYPTYVLKGRSLESFLDRRVLSQSAQFDQTLVPTILDTIFKENLISPTNKERRVPISILDYPSSMEKLKYSVEFDGESVLDALVNILGTLGYGFKFLRYYNENQYVLDIYEGTDRSYGQSKESWKVFSPKFNNLLKTQFSFDVSESCNAAVVCGEEESQTVNPTTGQVLYWPQVWTTIATGQETGWDRIEKFIDCSDVSRWQGDYIFGTTQMKPSEARTHGWKKLPESMYIKMIQAAAAEKMEDNGPEMTFDAEVDTNIQWRLGRDIFLGDLVEVYNEFNVGCVCRVSEITYSIDVNGQKVYPTFDAWGEVYYVNVDKGDEEEVWRSHMDFITRLTTTESTTPPNS